ncbi:methyltransferase-like protein 9 [Lingula anatina]|uniref:Methyltransferase-like protein 9 n=1 Tax=Lingula anatina TaxID=7574 RepID=A0A1S3HYC4_LINAN|nr:methyltransferase-like protein 9 [Lingula anatina]|eukprot:XP_013391027.1 methyltransferase-like protein 9 [Lingula anatina]
MLRHERRRVCKFIFLCTILLTYKASAMTDQMSSLALPEHQSSYRFRSHLARTVYQRMLEDRQHRDNDHSSWYQFNQQRLSKEMCDMFLQTHQDPETCQFLENCFNKADSIFTQLAHTLAKSVLTWFMTQTDANGLLRRGSMFVFSKQQFQDLLDIDESWKAATLLDLGAGDGKVTEKMQNHFEQVYATEASSPMRQRLTELGYTLLDIDEWHNNSVQYDVISCLNLLDRCDRPMTLLRDIHKVLKPGTGRLIVATVFPFSPYVEYNQDHIPAEYLYIQGKTFEDQVTSFVEDIFKPVGFKLLKFTRLPYLCEGDLNSSFYVLDDAVFVLERL